MDIFTKITESNDKIKALKTEIMGELKQSIQPVFDEFFDTYPQAKGIFWTQYTPYFNDGEPCKFGVNTIYLLKRLPDDEKDEDYSYRFLEVGENADELYPGDYSKKDLVDFLGEDGYAAAMKLHSLINDNPDSMADLYGDHMQIIVTKSNTETREYDHN